MYNNLCFGVSFPEHDSFNWDASQLKNVQNKIGSPYFLNLVVNITWGCSIKSECYFPHMC